MQTRLAATVAALVLGVATVSSAVAAPRASTWTGFAIDTVETTGTVGAPLGGLYSRNPATCAMSSAAEGNARQQNFPVQQYGQTSGGNRC